MLRSYNASQQSSFPSYYSQSCELPTSRDGGDIADDAWLIDSYQKFPSAVRATTVTSNPSKPLRSQPCTQWRWLPFVGLALTTPLTLLLLVAVARNYGITGGVYDTVASNRASVQIAVQVVAAGLGFFNVTALTHVINYAVRSKMRGSPISLNDLKVAAGFSTPMIAWRLPWIRLLAITIFAILAIVPSALWAGALTPITLDAIQHDTIVVPSYANADQMRLIKEYPSEGSDPTPSTWTSRGLFSYVVGMKFQGLLLSSVASAWTTDGRIRMHNKFDYTGYRYAGRSYGVGSSAGLIDDHLSSNPRTVSYQYQEPGYNTAATCVYNASSEFVLMETYDTMLWSASGPVPDSPIQSPEYSVYIGRGSNVIVAIGVTGKIERPRYVAFAAGANYSILNNVQCEISFSPALFNVTTHLEGRNITVTPNTISTPDIDPTGVLVKTAMRQYELIANDQTNIYVSFVGDSFNNSINAYRASLNTTSPDLDDSKAALAAIEASMTAMMDDMLVAYASAQLMIGNHTRSVPAAVKVRVLRFGENIYIYSIFVVNTLILLVVAVEAVRNSAWRRMPRFDFLDLDDLITYTWRACQSSLNAGRVPITGRSRLRLSTQAETLQLLR